MSRSSSVRRVAIVFSGGPAPAANAVISACTLSFLDAGIEVIGILDGYSRLQDHVAGAPLVEGEHFIRLDVGHVSGIRNRKSILIRTARANPSEGIEKPGDLADPACNRKLAAVYCALEELEVDGLVSIGGDDTLRTANNLHCYPGVVPGHRPISVVHLPKTIDNDYNGIDWTFGFASAVDYSAREIRNLGADASSTNTWYVLELMGRKSGWLTYAAGIAGEATRMISVEDVGETFDVDRCAADLAALMLKRESEGKSYGIVCVAEGLASLVAEDDREVDDRGYSLLGSVRIGERLARATERAYALAAGRPVHVRAKQIGYEVRCAEPVATDILLGSQLGVGAYHAIVEKGRAGHMVSVKDQLQLVYVPFDELIDPVTMKTRVRFIDTASDFYRLARALEYGHSHPES
ncbi:MAG TPA: 6-phosphofructokinase [Coriobacteriia bacterium]